MAVLGVVEAREHKFVDALKPLYSKSSDSDILKVDTIPESQTGY